MADTKSQGEAHWAVARPDVSKPATLSELVMAWARDSETGQPRYIFELGSAKRGAHCGCECYSCGLPLIAVNAGKSEWRRRPHFRHPDGAQKNTCLVLSARAAALETLRKHGVLTLPARRMGATITGLSGKPYSAWVTSPPEPVRISNFRVVDQVSAILTLEDGRQLKVDLTGKVDGELSGGMPTIVLTVDDPKIAAMSPDELKSRLHLLVEQAVWCNHWNDTDLTAQATRQAWNDAKQALDWLENLDTSGVSASGTRETLLHSLAKEVLAQAGCIRLPELSARAEVRLPNGNVETRTSITPGDEVRLGSVSLEKRFGSIRPDVVAEVISSESQGEAANPLTQGPLLVEVTVTNGIDAEREERIRAQGLPALELDLSRLGGTLTKEDFIRLLVEEDIGKRWVHHPWLVRENARLEAELAPLRIALNTPLDVLGRQYLEAVMRYSQAQTADGTTTALNEGTGEVARCAEALASRGYPEAKDARLWYDQGCILGRLLSIRHDKVVGYRLNTTWQVLNAILCEGEPYTMWQPLYLAALRTYRPALSDKHTQRVEAWRQEVKQSLESGQDKYRNNGRYNELIALLFPEMAALLRNPLPRGVLAAKRSGSEPGQDSPFRAGGHSSILTRDRMWHAGFPAKEQVAAAARSLSNRAGVSDQRIIEVTSAIASRGDLVPLTPADLAKLWSRSLGLDETDVAVFLVEAGYVMML